MGTDSPNGWLLRQKITIPDPVAGHLARTGLRDRAMPTRQPVTVLKAPAGFGKTTLLAECCRSLREDNVQTAWVALDEYDEPEVLDKYIVFACQSVGLDINDGSASGDANGVPWRGVALVSRAVGTLSGPFVLAIDEVDRLRNAASVGLLEFLLNRGPPNLHLAMTCRNLPVGLNVCGALVEGRVTMMGAEDLRFSKPEIAKIFNLRLSTSELAEIAADTAGWPFAVRIAGIRRDSMVPGSTHAEQDFAENWIESQLLRELGTHERDLLLDVGLFEWMDADLLDNVLQRTGSMRSVGTKSLLGDLLEPVPGHATDCWRLPPLIRNYCVRRRVQETPQRFKAINRRIAIALTKRGETVTAMRHAVEAGEAILAGDFLERAGGVRLHVREGVHQLRSADRLLSDDIISERPRLALVRCLALALSGRLAEARERYATVAATLPVHHGDVTEESFELSLDDYIVRTNIALYGCDRIGTEWVQALLSDRARFAESPRPDPATRGNLEYQLSIGYQLTAQFDEAFAHAELAREILAGAPRANIFPDLEIGQIAMAQGRVAEARSHYQRARRAFRKRHTRDAIPGGSTSAIAKVLLQELAMECFRPASIPQPPRVPRTLAISATSFSAYAAAGGVTVDLKLWYEGVEAALAATGEMMKFVRVAELPALVRYVSALRVSLLVTAARIGDAERAWRLYDLPEEPRDCLALVEQSWREMEALSCARLRLLTVQERFVEGRSFARDLCAAAAARGLRRTLMRGLSLSIALEHRAGEPAAAAGQLEEFLRLYSETPYAWPLVRERDASRPVVEATFDSTTCSPMRETMRSLLRAMRGPGESRRLPPALSRREWQVLERIEDQRDKEIAAALGLTAYGVRYHMRKLFAKLGARSRADAVSRAKELGLMLGGF